MSLRQAPKRNTEKSVTPFKDLLALAVNRKGSLKACKASSLRWLIRPLCVAVMTSIFVCHDPTGVPRRAQTFSGR